MKKNIVRILAFLLVLILALGILPLGALAVDDSYFVYRNYVDAVNPTYKDFYNAESNSQYDVVDPPINPINGSVSIKTSDYDKYYVWGDKLYDLQGVIVQYDDVKDTDPLQLAGSLTITDKNSSEYYGYFDLVYSTHQHRLSYWYSDSTTHWRECLVCKKHRGFEEPFMYQNWHSDGDEDRVCDVCNADIPYHEIEVEDTKGGKITVELEEAPHRKKIVANVEPEEGYKLKKLHFIKVRTDGSEQEITRRKTTKSSWWTYMPTYDLKVTAEFVKK